MIKEVEAGNVATIIVKDMSRLGRNYLQVGFYTEVLFPQKDVRFLAINNSIDSDNASDNDFAPFLNIMNEWYAKDTSNKIKAVFDARMKDGKRCSGSIPYGYNRLATDKQTLVVDPVASEVVKRMKRPLAYITAAWLGGDSENAEQAARYCRAVYEAGFSPICPPLYLPLFLNDAVPEEHKSGIDMGRDLLRRSHVLVVCGHTMTEAMKNDIAVAQRLGITATTLEGILTVKGQGKR